MEIIFAQPSHQYPSYGDFWRLVAHAGFPIVPLAGGLDLTREAVYVITPANGELGPAILEARTRATPQRAKIIWWNLERTDTYDRPLATILDEVFALVDAAWVSDRSTAALDRRFVHVVFGSHRALGKKPTTGLKWDLCTLAYLWGRRQDVVRRLADRKVTVAPEAWGPTQQDEVVGRSRLMLNMHQYDGARTLAPIRFAVAAAYGLPILTETVDDPYPHVIGEDLLTAPYEQLEAAVVAALRRSDLAAVGQRLQHRLCVEHPFRRGVEEGIIASGFAR